MARVYKRKDTDGWWLDYENADGERVRESAHTNNMAQAERILELKRQQAADERNFGDTQIQATSFREYIPIYIQTYAKIHTKPKVARRIESQLMAAYRVLGDKHLHRITTEEIVSFLASLKGKVSDSTINRYRSALHSLWKQAIQSRRARNNPVSFTAKLREPRPKAHYATQAQFGTMLQASPAWFKELLLMAVLTGLRVGALVGIRVENIDLNVGALFIDKDKDEEKYVTLSEQAQVLVRYLLRKPRPKDCPFLFYLPKCTRDDAGRLVAADFGSIDANSPWAPINVSAGLGLFRKTWDQVRKTAQLPGFKFHWLRQTHASWLAMAGADLRAIQKQLGHSKYDLTEARYAHLSPAYRSTHVDRIDSAITIGTYLAQKAGEAVQNTSEKLVKQFKVNDFDNFRCGSQVAKAEVCKTSIRGFESHPHLQI